MTERAAITVGDALAYAQRGGDLLPVSVAPDGDERAYVLSRFDGSVWHIATTGDVTLVVEAGGNDVRVAHIIWHPKLGLVGYSADLARCWIVIPRRQVDGNSCSAHPGFSRVWDVFAWREQLVVVGKRPGMPASLYLIGSASAHPSPKAVAISGSQTPHFSFFPLRWAVGDTEGLLFITDVAGRIQTFDRNARLLHDDPLRMGNGDASTVPSEASLSRTPVVPAREAELRRFTTGAAKIDRGVLHAQYEPATGHTALVLRTRQAVTTLANVPFQFWLVRPLGNDHVIAVRFINQIDVVLYSIE